ncbi:MAG: ATP-binding protein [Acidobacteria bacterium]|nr:ATP-binding protein [Acidobacteriota bacterium]
MKRLTSDDLREMVEVGAAESRHLSFKEELPGQLDSDRVRFLEEAASLANAGGGHLVYGVSDKRGPGGEPTGVAGEVVGVQVTSVENTLLRMESLLRAGVRPRIPACQLYAVEGFDRGPVIVFQTPRSWVGPHMVSLQEQQRFCSRNSAGKFRLDVDELRAAFGEREGFSSRWRAFRDQRLARVIAGELPVKLIEQPKVVVHLMPFSAFADQLRATPSDLIEKSPFFGLAPTWHLQRLVNIDGVVFFGGTGHAGFLRYLQIFRSGVVELILADMVDDHGGVRLIPTVALEDSLTHLVSSYLQGLVALGIEPPIVLAATLAGFHGFGVPGDDEEWEDWADSPPVIDRDLVLLPEVVLEDLSTPTPIFLAPVFDAVFHAAGRLHRPTRPTSPTRLS